MPLPRLQLFEFNDADWAPAALRGLIVESLSLTLERGGMLDALVDPFADFLAAAGTHALIDLGSGSGAPARILARALATRGLTPHIRLTDLYPRPDAWRAIVGERPDQFDFIAEPVDATAIPAAVGAGRARVIINVMHHFPPSLVRLVLADAVRSRQAIFIAESFGRNPLAALGFARVGLPTLFASPLRGSDRLARAALVWATPAALMAALWDTLVSTLRVYEEAELRALTADLGDDYHWHFGTHAVSRFGRGMWCAGLPRASARECARAPGEVSKAHSDHAAEAR